MPDLSDLEPALRARADDRCELCGATAGLSARPVPPSPVVDADHAVLACAACAAGIDRDLALDPKDWHGLREAAWSAVPAVQVVVWRLLERLKDEGWARDLLDQIYLDDDTLAWARAAADGDDPRPRTLDSHGAELVDGDAVTLIKDLDVKGGGFTAKRGTLVKGIRLTDDPGLIEGRVQGIGIVLKTEFLKKA